MAHTSLRIMSVIGSHNFEFPHGHDVIFDFVEEAIQINNRLQI